MYRLFLRHRPFLSFCLITAFFSGLGQTYFVAQFIPFIQEEFDLSLSKISGSYSLATLGSALCLSWVGKQLDQRSLGLILPVVLICLFCGFSLVAISFNILILTFGFFLLRLSGQTTLGMVATTLTGRYFGKKRGKALTLVSFGRAMAEGTLPSLAIVLMAYISWKWTLSLIAFLPLLIILTLFYLWQNRFPSEPLYEERETSLSKSSESDPSSVSWGFSQAWNEKKALMLMSGNCFLPFVITGLFFQQSSLALAKDWPMSLFATGFMAYSLFNILGNWTFGYLVDTIGSRRLLPFILIPFLFALFCLIVFNASLGVYFYMSFLGFGVGATSLIRNAFWAENYDLKVLGHLKGMDSSFTVIATGLAPFIFGFMIDRNIEVISIVWGCLIMGLFFLLFFIYLASLYKNKI